MQPTILRIGTRGSRLATIQAEMVQQALYAKGVLSELVIVKTSGDSFMDKPFRDAGVGAFVREIDDHVRAGDVDLAVHSMKDVPTKRPQELALCAVLPRASPYDVLVHNDALHSGMIVGTSSLRRRAQMARYYPSLTCRNIRGNIDTRIRKLASGEYNGLVLAEAGIERLDLPVKTKRLPFVPSPNQGIVCVVARRALNEYETIAALNHTPTLLAGTAERIIMEVLGGGCLVPLGIFAHPADEMLTVSAEVLSLNGERAVRLQKRMSAHNYQGECRAFAKQIIEQGGDELIAEALAQNIQPS